MKILTKIDLFLNNITMYRLVLYYLIALLIIAGILTLFGTLPFSLISLTVSTVFIVVISYFVNLIFSKAFHAIPNVESFYITALILALIITPIHTLSDLWFLGWAAALAMASKFILSLNKKHFFNPAAIAVVITAIALGQSASWWVGTLSMLPFVLIGGLLIVRKIKRTDLVYYFILVSILAIVALGILKGSDLLNSLSRILIYSPLFFFAFVMLTEPLTTPPNASLQIGYGALVGLLALPQVHLGSLYSTPELALVAGNIFSYLVSPKEKMILKLKEKLQIAPDVLNFSFVGAGNINFKPGQYMEWTLPGHKADNRGNRRYFTLSSAPTESTVEMGIKFDPNPSTFKQTLLAMKPGDEIMAGQLAGDFVLPRDKNKKLVFIAGGIGITPFRSMIKYLVDQNEKRDITLLFTNRNAAEIVYRDVFDQAQAIGLKTVYTLTDKESVPLNWQGQVGRINSQMIVTEVPDYSERTFYISGPHSIVQAMVQVLSELNIPKTQIITDYFPGFA